MLISLSQAVGGYLYEVFIEKLDFWLVLGLFGQMLFGARFIVQWLVSEKEGRSVIPVAFWFFSIGGGLITLAYGLHQREPVIILGQALSIFIYVRNLMLINRDKRRAKSRGGAPQ
ncbi:MULTISPECIES: lipid-A-disaccharide synthase N-terminal domain-containing protein [unclassified Chelatococcus]|uniref:lipid-A-disaccharide synthase N-terminal domain-containing protein n=1 Tax=unclassified Chelatococcus TaxID=2638111 RepID=UPI001BCE6963|nr:MULTISPECIES: lipid-A-disaccharide synthase N-terminal domain-containing protein [unclassified Chelatococcus]MBS7699498.1 lipid-A-disaccharide synthase N-terminal domain-containing protein [Chelatococcus sp. YT9]MBX3559583.1 lipid-A-disaccharide synthase N-terminal domain-containing protein [Chelatococcus sp.]